VLSLAKEGRCDDGLIDLFTLDFSQLIDVRIVEGAGHAVLHAFGIAVAEIAFSRYPLPVFKMDTPKGTGAYTKLAAHTHGFFNNHGVGYGVTPQGTGRTNAQACSCFALLTGHGKKGSQIHIHMDPDIGIFTSKPARVLERANSLTIAASQAPILFDKNHFHGDPPVNSSSYCIYRCLLIND
jgi:hypothetical protein